MSGQCSHHKGSREKRLSINFRKSRAKKRQPLNPKLIESDAESFRAAAKKLKMDTDVPEVKNIEYRILNFITVFATLSTFLKCKDCDGEVDFGTASTRGLGFKITLSCQSCPTRSILSCPLRKNTYEINRRFIITMRILGLGLKGAQRFCGLMDMPAFLYRSTYDMIVKHIHSCVKLVAENFFKAAVEEEILETSENTGVENAKNLTVSGDGTWQKRGFTSLFGVTSIIGFYTGKVLDTVIKSFYCKVCEFWKQQKDTAEFEAWFETHQSECLANHTGSSGKIEADAVIEIFNCSQEKYGVRYLNYVGNGDSEIDSQIITSNPYGDTPVVKKECIGHVQKRMGKRLRNCMKTNKNIGEKGKLTAKMIDKLTVYYGLAIKRNYDSVEDMKNAIWSTFDHYRSTDEHPCHNRCPTGPDSWCTWQRASAEGLLKSFKHDYEPLPDEVIKDIQPIYEDLSKDALLERCVGGFNQNNNDSYNQLVWKIAPNILHCGYLNVQIAAYMAAILFNEGNMALLKIFEGLGVQCGANTHVYVTHEDNDRLFLAEQQAYASTKEGRISWRQNQIKVLEAFLQEEDVGPGIDDSV